MLCCSGSLTSVSPSPPGLVATLDRRRAQWLSEGIANLDSNRGSAVGRGLELDERPVPPLHAAKQVEAGIIVEIVKVDALTPLLPNRDQ